ncbi:MAG: hypothetical protein ACFNM4_06735, partial [Prevotella nigrescens]
THTHTHTGAPSLVYLKNTLFLRARGNSRRPLQAKDFPGNPLPAFYVFANSLKRQNTMNYHKNKI